MPVSLVLEFFDGQTILSERVRRMFLAVLSFMLARAGRANASVLRRVLASWTYCSLFRRPFMCLLGDFLKQLPKVANDACVYAIPRETREDLAMLFMAAPFIFTHLIATHFPTSLSVPMHLLYT